MAARPSVQWALDTNFLLNLAAGKELAGATREVALERNVRLHITSVVISELQNLTQAPDLRSELAFLAFERLRNPWKIEPLVLGDVDKAISVSFADACVERRLIPVTERNDGLVIGEAAVKGIPFVISSDQHLLSIESADLAAVCMSQDVALVSVLHPFQARRSLER